MGVGATQFFRANHLARCSLYQRRPAQEYGSLISNDHRFVTHRRHISPARCARPHDAGDLRNPLQAHSRLVEKDAAEVVAVREYFRLVG